MKKNFITGFIAGGVICATVTGFAVEYAVTANPYPVKVNGVETTIQGYNINDNTYFKLRDVADAVGGFKVDFVEGTITIDVDGAVNSEPAVTPTIKPSSEIPPQATELNPVFPPYYDKSDGLTSDGIPIKVSDDGEKYVSRLDIDEVYHYTDYGYIIGSSLEDENMLELYKKSNYEVFITNIPKAKDEIYPTYEAYETMIRPFLVEHCK